MRPAEARRLAKDYDLITLREQARRITGGQAPELEILGPERSDQLTHVLLALRIREKHEAGMPLLDAFRAVMRDVRLFLTND